MNFNDYIEFMIKHKEYLEFIKNGGDIKDVPEEYITDEMYNSYTEKENSKKVNHK